MLHEGADAGFAPPRGGGERRDPLSVVVIGGQSLSLFLTLVVIPVAYSRLDDLAAAVRSNRTLGPATEPLQT